MAALLAGALVLSACGGGSSGSADGSGSGGVLRLAGDLSGDSGAVFDPSVMIQATPFWLISPVYGSFLHELADGSYEPDLAESVAVADPSTLEVKLFPDQKFSDGSVFDAEAVKWSLERTVAAKSAGLDGRLQEVDSIDVKSPTEFTISLKTPIAGSFVNLLAQQDTAVVSKKAVDDGIDITTHPVGAGPFVMKSFKKEASYVLEKNPDYVHADKIALDGVEVTHATTADPQVQANLLLSKKIDAAAGLAQLSPDNLGALENGGLKTSSDPSDSYLASLSFCKNRPPFDDERVRQAISYAIDRDELVELGAQGYGEAAWDWFPKGSSNHDPEAEGNFAHDPAKAKELLAEAGMSNLKVTMSASSGPLRRPAEVIQAQLREAGIDVEVKVLAGGEWVQSYLIDAKQDFAISASGRKGVDKVSRWLLPGTTGNVCGWDDPKLNSAVAEAAGLEDGTPELNEAWKTITDLTIENGVMTVLYFQTDNAAWSSDTIDKIEFTPDSLRNLNVDVTRTTLK